MKKKIAILGYGMRGGIYAGYAAKYPEEFEVAAIVDNDPEKLKLARARFGCPAYSDIRSFLADGIAADIAAICTQDAQHKEHAVRCMQAGYDLLLEKPIAASPEDCLAIEAAAEKYERRVIVCHVLRYTPFYRKIKEIVSSGKLGKIMTLCATENVGYYHQAHSFVRGPWRNSADSCPMILAKCCHDLDIIRWLVGEKCTEVSSFGSLGFFTLENAPAESAAYCSDCPVKDCVYNAQKIYEAHEWMANYFMSGDKTLESIAVHLRHTQYDRCVFRSDNDAVDHQVTAVKFEGGATAVHQMTAFSKEIYRDIKIHGTKAELYGVMEENFVELRPFGGETERIDLTCESVYGNHGGGDAGLMRDVYLALNGRPTTGMSYLDVSMDSHKIAFAAERSRTENKTIHMK